MLCISKSRQLFRLLLWMQWMLSTAYGTDTILFGGRFYAMLSGVDAFDSYPLCQSAIGFMPLRSGYMLAGDNSNSIAVLASYRWSTHVGVLSNGHAYNTLNYGNPGAIYGTGYLAISGFSYSVTSCSMQILQVYPISQIADIEKHTDLFFVGITVCLL